MRLFLSATLVMFSVATVMVRADVTIRYKTEMGSPIPGTPAKTGTYVIHMKGNQGVTINDGETEIVDFGRQQVTIIDTVRRKYATFPASEYGTKMAQRMTDTMPETSDIADMLKSVKSTCETKESPVPETIQGVQAREHDVTCTMTMSMPADLQEQAPGIMTGMTMKMVMRTWSAAPSERLRVPGLRVQLSGF